MVLMRPVIYIQKVIMYWKCNNEIIDELFKSLLQNYEKGLEESMRGCNFVFDSVDLLYYHPQKNLKRTRLSYIYILQKG